MRNFEGMNYSNLELDDIWKQETCTINSFIPINENSKVKCVY